MSLRSLAASRSVLVVGGSVLLFVLVVYGGVIENEATRGLNQGVESSRPLLSVSFTVNRWIGGDSAASYQVGNVILHLGSVIALLALLHRLSMGPGMMLGTLAFGLHPMFVDAVAWTEGRADLLATLLGLMAVLLHLRGGVTGHLASWLAVLLALLCKESAAFLPAACLAYDGLYRNRSDSRRALLWNAGALLVVLGFFAVRALRGPIGLRMDHAADAYAFLFLNILPQLAVPFGLQSLQPFDLPSSMAVGTVLAVVALGSVATVAVVRSLPSSLSRGIAWGWLWFVLALVPVGALADIEPVGGRLAYFPAVGLAVMAAAAFDATIASLRRMTVHPHAVWVAALGAGAYWLSLGWIAETRVRDWRTQETLLAAELQTNPDNPIVLHALGQVYVKQERFKEACPLLERSVALRAEIDSRYSLAQCFESSGRIAEAIRVARSILSEDPEHEGSRRLLERNSVRE